MLIHLDGSAIDDAIATGGSSEMSRSCIENFLVAHHTGKHVVSLDWEHLEALGSLEQAFSLRARGALKSIRSQQAEIARLRNRVVWHMALGLGREFNGGSAKTETGREVFRIDLHKFHDPERAARSVLLGENPTDAELYATVGKAFVAHKGWRAQISFEERGGGGSTIGPVFAKLVSDGRIVLAIADSDKKHPTDKIGGTAQGLLGIEPQAFQRVHVLSVRCAENLLRSAIYKEAFAAYERKTLALVQLMHAENVNASVPWRDHADLKYGIKLFQVRKIMQPGSAESSFWSSVAADLKRDLCLQAPPRQCASVDDCACYVSDALGKDALELAVVWMRTQNPQRKAKLLGVEQSPALHALCEELLAWGIAPVARPT